MKPGATPGRTYGDVPINVLFPVDEFHIAGGIVKLGVSGGI